MYIYDQNFSDPPLTEGGAVETSPPAPMTQRPGDTLPYREAMEQTERKRPLRAEPGALGIYGGHADGKGPGRLPHR